MSGTRPDGGSASDIAPRPLPPHPNLEFERKRAKKYLRELRLGDANAKLADAQFAISREYGFASWPRLVEYFKTLERHENSASPPAWYPLEQFEQQVTELVRQHERKREAVCARLATFVPRFYGVTAAHVADSTVSVDEARLVVARENRLASWDALVEWLKHEEPMHREGWNQYDSPRMKILSAIRSDDIAALGAILDDHPELLKSIDRFGLRSGGNAMYSVLIHDFRTGTDASRRMVDYVVSRGGRLNETVNQMLLNIMGYGHSDPRDRNSRFMEYLISRGADPQWIAPNGYNVIEHMLVRQRTREDVAFILGYIKPRKAFWVAAALDDVDQLKVYVRADGTLTEAGRKHRPDFTALGPFATPSSPAATDLEIIAEAFYVALINERYESMDFLLDRGFPVDYSYWGYTPFHWGLNSRNVKLLEYFVKRGARVDIEGSSSAQKDQWLFEADPTNADARRIYELSGGNNYDAVLARYQKNRESPPTASVHYTATLDRAREEAARLGQSEVTDDNLFVAMLRDERMILSMFGGYGVDLKALRNDYATRLVPGDKVPSRELPLAADLQATIDAAVARRQQMHWRQLNSTDLLRALMAKDSSSIVQMLVRCGLRLDKVREALDRM